MERFFDLLDGRKTYLAAFGIIAYLIWCQSRGIQPSAEIIAAFNALGLIFLRQGVEKSGPIFEPPPVSSIPSNTPPKLP